MTAITGRTRVIGHLGVPTEVFRAPMIYNPYFEDAGIDAVVVPLGCEAADYPQFVRLLMRQRNVLGALVTMPHKVTSLALLDEASPAATVAGSVNAIRPGPGGTLVGDMFDGEGFVRGLARRGRAVAGASALVVGAGGVGSAIAASLAAAGIARLGLTDVRPGVVEALAKRLARAFPACALALGTNDPAGWDIVVNATPLGMNPGDPLPVDPARVDPSTFVGEVVMAADETPFLAAVRARGCVTQIGTDMLFEMIPAYLEFFGLPTTTPARLRALARLGPDLAIETVPSAAGG